MSFLYAVGIRSHLRINRGLGVLTFRSGFKGAKRCHGQASSGLRLQYCKIWIAFLFGGLHLELKSIKKEDLIADWIALCFRF